MPSPVTPITTLGLPDRRNFFLEEDTAGFQQYVGASFTEGVATNPYTLEARQGLFERAGGEMQSLLGPEEDLDPLMVSDVRPITKRLTADEARARFADAEVKVDVPDDGYTEEQIDLLIEWKREEQRRQVRLSRPPGAGAVAAGFGAGLAASMLDPLNVSSAFIPAVGPARYAAWLARAEGPMGRAAVRAGVGAVEGGVGAAIIEPLVYTSARAIQADYDLVDSMLNIAFGTFIGGGLHMGAGAVSDALARGVDPRAATPQQGIPQAVANLPSQQQEAVGRAALGQAMEGRAVDVEPLTRQIPAPGEDAAAPLRIETARQQALEEIREEVTAELEGRVPEGTPTAKQAEALAAERRHVARQLDELDATFGERAKRIQKTEKRTSRKQAERKARKEIDAERKRLETRREEIDGALAKRESARQARGELDRLARGEAPAHVAERVEARARQLMGEANMRSSVRSALDDWRSDMTSAAQRTARPEAIVVADPAADAKVTETVDARSKPAEQEAADVDTDLADAQARVKELEDQLEIDGEDAEMTKAADVIDQTKAMGRALRAAAVCQMRQAA